MAGQSFKMAKHWDSFLSHCIIHTIPLESCLCSTSPSLYMAGMDASHVINDVNIEQMNGVLNVGTSQSQWQWAMQLFGSLHPVVPCCAPLW